MSKVFLKEYINEYNNDDINQFRNYIAENYFNNGPKCKIMNNYLVLHDKLTELILFQCIHPKFRNIFPSGYIYSSIKIDEYFCDDKFDENNIADLLKAKDIYEKSCIDGNPLLFIVIEFPRKDNAEMSDILFILTDDI